MERIGGTIRKYNSNKSITQESYYYQARTIGKRIIKGVEQMRFEYCVEPDTAFGNHHLHFYLEYPTSTTQLISDTLLSFIGVIDGKKKRSGMSPPNHLKLY